MGRLEDGGQRVTLVPWPHRRVHPVRLQRAAAAALSYDDYLASLEGEDAEEGGLFGFVLHRESLLRSSLPCPSIPGSGRSRFQVRVQDVDLRSVSGARPLPHMTCQPSLRCAGLPTQYDDDGSLTVALGSLAEVKAVVTAAAALEAPATRGGGGGASGGAPQPPDGDIAAVSPARVALQTSAAVGSTSAALFATPPLHSRTASVANSASSGPPPCAAGSITPHPASGAEPRQRQHAGHVLCSHGCTCCDASHAEVMCSAQASWGAVHWTSRMPPRIRA